MGNLRIMRKSSLPSTGYESSHSSPHKITNGGHTQNFTNYCGTNDTNESDSQCFEKYKNGFYKTKSNQLMTYSTFEILGEGSFGIVYAARNQNNELLAIKYKRQLKDENLMQKSVMLFRSELEALFNLDHSNIVKLLGVEFQNNEAVGLVMEYIIGEPLDTCITNSRYLREPIISSFTRQLVDAIAYMHSRFVMHRDIKSSNIMVIKKKYIKLIDFGMAKLLHVNPESYKEYQTNTCVGTAPYMAPEVKNFHGYDSKADIYSIGAVLYEMATGDVFVHNANEFNYKTVMLQQINGAISVYSLSPQGNDFLQKCLIKDANLRPSARGLLQHPFLITNRYNGFSRLNSLSRRSKNPFLR